MAIESGTKYRISVNGKVIYAATQGQSNHEANFRNLIHKDNPGDHTEKIPDGKDSSYQITFFFDQAAPPTHLSYAELFDIWNSSTIVNLEVSNGVDGDKYTQTVYIGNLGKQYTVRDNVVANATLEGSGAITRAAV